VRNRILDPGTSKAMTCCETFSLPEDLKLHNFRVASGASAIVKRINEENHVPLQHNLEGFCGLTN
jgi:hypothetical protein